MNDLWAQNLVYLLVAGPAGGFFHYRFGRLRIGRLIARCAIGALAIGAIALMWTTYSITP